jgi:hypothetical protein
LRASATDAATAGHTHDSRFCPDASADPLAGTGRAIPSGE